jgi:very-short-patch-repair endonuclease
MSTVEKLAELRTTYAERSAEHFDFLLGRSCESPIEELLMGRMLASDWVTVDDRVRWSDLYAHCKRVAGWDSGRSQILIYGPDGEQREWAAMQLPIQLGEKRYRLDFAFFLGEAMFAVEIDGHDFHERTKEQARRDKSRDRALTSTGWSVLRFTGSEIYADPSGCLDQITDATFAADRRLRGLPPFVPSPVRAKP